jgi:phage terminase small subunit
MARKRPGETLTDKQRTFCNEYVIELNATKAAIAAGYSEDSARSTGSHLLDDPDVAAYIRRLQEDKFLNLRITAEQVLAELARIGFADFEEEIQEPRSKSQDLKRGEKLLASLSWKKGENFRDANGKVVDPQEQTQEPRVKSPDIREDHSMVKRAAMSYRRVVVDEATGTRTTYTFSLRDKIMALRIIAQHLGLFLPDKTKGKIERILIAPKGRVFEKSPIVRHDEINPDKG